MDVSGQSNLARSLLSNIKGSLSPRYQTADAGYSERGTAPRAYSNKLIVNLGLPPHNRKNEVLCAAEICEMAHFLFQEPRYATTFLNKLQFSQTGSVWMCPELKVRIFLSLCTSRDTINHTPRLP